MTSSARLSLALALLVAACDDDTTPAPPLDASVPLIDTGVTTPAPVPDAAVADAAAPIATMDAALPQVAPLYVGSSRVFDPSGSNGYLFTFGSLEKGTTIDLKAAIEIEDAWVFGDAKPYFFTATIFQPTLQRWTVSADGKFTPGPVLDFKNQGVLGAFTAAAIPMFSAEKSYFLDVESLQVVVWNPKDMTFIKTIPLDAAPVAGLKPQLDPNITFQNGKAYVSVYWASQESMWTEYGPSARLISFDTNTDTVLASTDDTRTSSLTPAGTTSTGTTYFSPWDYHAAVRGVFGAGYGAASNAIRVVSGANAPDQSFVIDLSALVGGRPAGNMYLLNDNEGLIHVWHNELINATAANWSDKRFEPGYLWHRFRIGESTSEPLPDQKPSVEGGEWDQLEGKVVSYAPDSEYANTTLWELQADGRQRELLTVPGWTTAVLRAY